MLGRKGPSRTLRIIPLHHLRQPSFQLSFEPFWELAQGLTLPHCLKIQLSLLSSLKLFWGVLKIHLHQNFLPSLLYPKVFGLEIWLSGEVFEVGI